MAAGAPLTGRIAVVTGASRGIGRAVARALHAAGAHVALIARGAEALRSAAAELGDRALAVPADVGDVEAARGAAARITAELGAPSILVNNAGLFRPAPVDQISAESFAETIAVNLVAPFALLSALLPPMRAAGAGHIVTIGSIADRSIFPGNAAYAASKYGARALHEILRAELARSGVRVSLVSPGPTDTSIWDALELAGSRFPRREEMLAPEAVADAVLFAVTRPAGVNIDELRLTSA